MGVVDVRVISVYVVRDFFWLFKLWFIVFFLVFRSRLFLEEN